MAAWPEVLFLDASALAEGVAALRGAFHEESEGALSSMLCTTPRLLDRPTLVACLRGGGHLMPRKQLASSLKRYPDFYLQFQSLRSESRGDRDADYLAEMRAAE